MAAQIPSVPLPPEADVEVSVRIHAPLNVTRHAARQKVNGLLGLHCGQNFALEEPELQVGDRTAWRVPVWVTHAERGRVSLVGELRVDAQTGEVQHTREQLRLLQAAANGVLEALKSAE